MESDSFQVIETFSETENSCTRLVRHPSSNQLYIHKMVNREVPVYAQLHSCNIAGIPRIYQMRTGGGKTEVLEEFLNGKSLEEYVHINGFLSEEEACRILRSLCAILLPLHRMGIVHRDIKPSNIIMTPGGALYLIDFDAARQYKGSNQEDTVLLGTKGYAAPEQYGYAQTDCRSDIYALGVTVNRLITGALPGEKIASGMLEPIIRKCTQLDPAGRYSDCSQILTDLNVRASREPPTLPMPPRPATAPHRTEWWRFLILGFGSLLLLCIEFDQRPFTFDTLSEYCLDLVIFIPPMAYLIDLLSVRTRPPFARFRTGWRRVPFGLIYFSVWFAVLIAITAVRSSALFS